MDKLHRAVVLGKLIRRGRESAGLTLRQLADLVGSSSGHICDLENGRVKGPSVFLIKAIADNTTPAVYDAVRV